MRLRILALVAAALTGLLGPQGLRTPQSVTPVPRILVDSCPDEAHAPTPRRRTTRASSRPRDRRSSVERPSSRSRATRSGSVGRAARAGRKVGQQADADADAKLNHPENEKATASAWVPSAAGDDHGVQIESRQRRRERSASLGVGQQQEHPGNAQSANAASGDQSANASARADVDRPANGNVTARIKRPVTTRTSTRRTSDCGVRCDASASDRRRRAAGERRCRGDAGSATRPSSSAWRATETRTAARSRTLQRADAAVTSDDPDAEFECNAGDHHEPGEHVRLRPCEQRRHDGRRRPAQHDERVGDGERRDRGRDHDRSRGRRVDVLRRGERRGGHAASDGENTDVRVDVENDSLPLPSSAPNLRLDVGHGVRSRRARRAAISARRSPPSRSPGRSTATRTT